MRAQPAADTRSRAPERDPTWSTDPLRERPVTAAASHWIAPPYSCVSHTSAGSGASRDFARSTPSGPRRPWRGANRVDPIGLARRNAAHHCEASTEAVPHHEPARRQRWSRAHATPLSLAHQGEPRRSFAEEPSRPSRSQTAGGDIRIERCGCRAGPRYAASRGGREAAVSLRAEVEAGLHRHDLRAGASRRGRRP